MQSKKIEIVSWFMIQMLLFIQVYIGILLHTFCDVFSVSVGCSLEYHAIREDGPQSELIACDGTH